MPSVANRRLLKAKGERFLKQALLAAWFFLSLAALLSYHYYREKELLWIVPFPILVLFGFYFLVFFHEGGHFVAGLLLGFPVTGIEFGTFPFTSIRIRKFTFRVGKLPWLGRTLLGVSSRTFSPFQRFLFASGGMFFEFLFFVWFYFATKDVFLLRIVGLCLFADQIAVNLFPRYEKGHAANDGALLLEIFFPGKVRSL